MPSATKFVRRFKGLLIDHTIKHYHTSFPSKLSSGESWDTVLSPNSANLDWGPK